MEAVPGNSFPQTWRSVNLGHNGNSSTVFFVSDVLVLTTLVSSPPRLSGKIRRGLAERPVFGFSVKRQGYCV